MIQLIQSRDRGGSVQDHRELIDEILHDKSWIQISESSSILDKLPAEILQQVLSYLSARDLARMSATCRLFTEHCKDDRLWAALVNSHLPTPIHDPGLFSSFRHLYLTHLSYWFIPQHKIWFADNEHTGNLILARYDNRRGVIEGYRVVADRGTPSLKIWQSNPDVMIQSFDPQVRLWLDDPVLLLKDHDEDPTNTDTPRDWMLERRMPMPAEAQHVYSSLVLCPKEPREPAEHEVNTWQEQLWPPPLIPSDHRTQRDLSTNQLIAPSCSSQASEFAFRIRRWANFRLVLSLGHNEALTTYSTLDPQFYLPTKEKPYQGIWVGDYSAHGCEFLLFIQRDPVGVQDPDETENNADSVVHKGSFEAIKLTGDPNVPRGEVSFRAEDIGPNGLVRVDSNEPFENARIVHCRGHVAGIGFQDDSFITSQLILISPDYIAHYWEVMGHVSYYRRVDIDSLIQS
ncbi:hypothetical protein N7493_010690 [Penicillium malachiteum]|uniref:F-box domain-containing protein n=1 Tax=Penicillium malachiteum TaxID=1324776 RepID=A0AAD6MRW8_9EURO|nr:hypothetical protein N7493_010690 [Penicillium malachiteum]